MNESWDQLCGRLKISGGTDPLCTDENLIDFEQESWISLPSGYREYCRRMGSGEIAGTLRIYCPCSVASLADLRRFPYSMGNFREDVEFAIAHSSPPIGIDQEKVPLLRRLCDDGLIFGGTNASEEIVLWDLTSNRPEDDNYDIYWVNTEKFNDTFLIGRDFFEFINEFAFAENPNRVLPFKYWESFADVEQKGTFVRFGEEMFLDQKALDDEADAFAITEQIRSGTFLAAARKAESEGNVLEALRIYIKADYALQHTPGPASESELFTDVQASIGRQFRQVDYDRGSRVWFDVVGIELPVMMWMFYRSLLARD